jgi:hypothetical protein
MNRSRPLFRDLNTQQVIALPSRGRQIFGLTFWNENDEFGGNIDAVRNCQFDAGFRHVVNDAA